MLITSWERIHEINTDISRLIAYHRFVKTRKVTAVSLDKNGIVQQWEKTYEISREMG